MSALRLFEVLSLVFFLCWCTTQVYCEETSLYAVNENGTIVTKDTRVFNNFAEILFIQCLCLRNTSTCSTKDNPVPDFGPAQQSASCNIIDLESSDITFRRSGSTWMQCGRENSRTIVTLVNKNVCPNQCLVIRFPSIDIAIPKIEFVNASQQCEDFQASLRSSTTIAVPGRTTKISNKTTMTSSPSIVSTTTTTTMTPILTTTITPISTTITPNSATSAPSEAGGISTVTIILTCSIFGALIVIIITCTVVIIRRKKVVKRSLVDPKKRNPLVYHSGQDDLTDAYSRPSHGHDYPGDDHTYKQIQYSSYANEGTSGVFTPVAYANLDYSLPSQAVASDHRQERVPENRSLQSSHEESGAYIEIIDAGMSNPGKTLEYLSLYDKPEATYRDTYTSPYAPVVSAPRTNVDRGHQYLSLKVSDSDGVYVDAFSVNES